MGESRVPVDLLNPGQVFACLGLMEATEILLGPCEGGFFAARGSTSASFTLTCAGPAEPVGEILDFLRDAQVSALAPLGWIENVEPKTGPRADIERVTALAYWGDRSVKPSSFPVKLSSRRLPAGPYLLLSHWVEPKTTGRDKCAFGWPTSTTIRADMVRQFLRGIPAEGVTADNLFQAQCQISNGFRFDWRRDNHPLEDGFTKNDHEFIKMMGYPLVEILSGFGLENARPSSVTGSYGMTYDYGISTLCLPTMLVRAVLGAGKVLDGGASPASRDEQAFRRFRLRRAKVGESKSSPVCIVQVNELIGAREP